MSGGRRERGDPSPDAPHPGHHRLVCDQVCVSEESLAGLPRDNQLPGRIDDGVAFVRGENRHGDGQHREDRV